MRLSSLASRSAVSIATVSLIAGCGGGGDNGGADGGNGGPAESRISYVAELTLPSIGSGGEPTCCKDFGEISRPKIEEDADIIDNAFAQLANSLETLAEIDIQAAMNAQLEEGRLVILFEHEDLRSETDTFRLDGFFGAFAGATTYTEASAGQGSFSVLPNSYDASGTPLIRFDNASMQSGSMTAGPAIVGASFPVADGAIAVQLHGTEITGEATLSEGGVSYSSGTIAGYLLLEDVFGAMNDFLKSDACACLNLDGRDVFVEDNGSWDSQCVDGEAHTCEEDSSCVNLAVGGGLSICGALPPTLEAEADIRTDSESSGYQGLSIGYAFSSVPAEIVE